MTTLYQVGKLQYYRIFINTSLTYNIQIIIITSLAYPIMLDSLEGKYNRLVHKCNPTVYSVIRLFLYVILIFAAHLTAGILAEKIYKTPYPSNNQSMSDPQTGEQNKQGDILSNPFTLPIVNSFVVFCYGFIVTELCQSESDANQQISNQYQDGSYKQYIKYAALSCAINVSVSLAFILTSFTIINLANCCSFLVVVLIGAFCSKASLRYKVQKKSIINGFMICVGVVFYNLQVKKDSQSNDKPLTVISTVLIIVLLFMEGYRPQLGNKIREDYTPSPTTFVYMNSKYELFFVLLLSVVTWQIWPLLVFIWQHDRVIVDLLAQSVLDLIGVIFIFRIVVQYKQHLAPMIITIRKIVGSIVNIIYYHHEVSQNQKIGLAIVITFVVIELVFNFISYHKYNKVQDSNENKAKEPIQSG